MSRKDRTTTEQLVLLFSDVLIFASQRLLGTQVVFVEQVLSSSLSSSCLSVWLSLSSVPHLSLPLSLSLSLQLPLAMINPPKRSDSEITFLFEKTHTAISFQSTERCLYFFEKFSDAVTTARSHRVFGVDLDELFRQVIFSKQFSLFLFSFSVFLFHI